MKAKLLAALTIAAATASCAAPIQGDQDEASLESSAEALTVAECATQRDTCLRNNPFFGFFTCPAQYTQCVATASNGIPAEVASAISDTAACNRTQATCLRNAAGNPQKVLACTQAEAQCIADIVDARLPQVVSDTLTCVDDAATCIRASETAGDLAGCAETFQDCAIDVAVEALPPEVGAVVEDIGACLATLNSCTAAATTPAQVTACGQAEVRCVATGLGVTLPDVPVAEAVQCAETAAQCGLNATSAAAVRECGAALVACNARLTMPNKPLTCEEKWTQCLVRNPLNFLGCSLQLANCQSGG
jgi:hypothetical protein